MHQYILTTIAVFFSFQINLVAQNQQKDFLPEDLPNLLCFWDFQKSRKGQFTSKGAFQYTLTEMNGPIKSVNDGIFGKHSLEIVRGQWMRIKRENCPALNIHGNREVTVIAWIKRKVDVHWQYIAGVWNEHDAKRQYALFTSGHKQADYVTLDRTVANHQPHGYVSDVGGATPGRPFCFSYGTGNTTIEKDKWYMIAYTYDQNAIRVFTNGKLDTNNSSNPFYWDQPIFDGGKGGADFTIAQRHVPSWPEYPKGMPGNKVGFGGILGGIAVYDRALTPEEISKLYEATLTNKKVK